MKKNDLNQKRKRNNKTLKLTSLLFVFLFITTTLNAKDKPLLDKKISLSKFKSTRAAFLDSIYKKNIPVFLNYKADKKKFLKQQVALEGGEKLLDKHLDEILKETNLFYRIENNKTLYIDSEWLWLKKTKPGHKTYQLGVFHKIKEEINGLLENYLIFYKNYECHFDIKSSSSDQIIITGNPYIQNSARELLKQLEYAVTDYSVESPNLSLKVKNFFKGKTLDLIPMKINSHEFLTIISKTYQLPLIFKSTDLLKTLKSTQIILANKVVNINDCFAEIEKATGLEFYYQKNIGLFVNEFRFQKLAPVLNLKVKCYYLSPFLKHVSEKFIKKSIKDSIQPKSWEKIENHIYYNSTIKALIIRCHKNNFTAIDQYFFKLGKKHIKFKKLKKTSPVTKMK